MSRKMSSDSESAHTSEVESQLLGLVERELGRSAQPGDRLSQLGVDSVTLAGFLGELEKRFGIEADAEILDVDTLDELVRYIEQRQ